MTRAPFNVAVFPYRPSADGSLEYALLRRADAGFWQGVSGGGENDEIPLEAARRETFEETGIPSDAEFLRLDTVEPIPIVEFSFRGDDPWGENVYVIPQYWFGVRASDRKLVLSHEHTESRWLSYEDADRLLKFDGNKTALWELNQRLKGRGPRG